MKEKQDKKEDQYILDKAKRTRPEEFHDDADFAARFAFSPRLNRLGFAQDKFKHINKNLVLTHLSNNEVKKANLLIDAIQVLMNHNETTYYILKKNKGEVEIPKHLAIEYEKRGYTVISKTDNRFSDVLDRKIGSLFGMTSTASGAGAALLKEWKQQRIKQEQSIREEQEPKGYFSMFNNRNNRKNNNFKSR